jgi:hypothetical protein
MKIRCGSWRNYGQAGARHSISWTRPAARRSSPAGLPA